MFKLAVLCAFLAAATADPAAVIAPLSYSNVVAPAPVVTSHPSSLFYSSPVIATSPVAYDTPYGFAHLIKKRAVAVGNYVIPSTNYASSPYTYSTAPVAAPLAGTYAAPWPGTYSAPLYSAAHLIKKRGIYVAPSPYVAPVSYSATAPFVASTYAAAPVVSTPLVSSGPVTYTHFIKKRSAPVLAYSAPTSFSHQSRFDYQATSPAITTYSTYGSPLAYPNTFGVVPV